MYLYYEFSLAPCYIYLRVLIGRCEYSGFGFMGDTQSKSALFRVLRYCVKRNNKDISRGALLIKSF